MRLVAPGRGTRALGDRVKQALFASLEADAAATGVRAAGARFPAFLDLFAGSGAAGIEALSRGAPRVVFVERDAGAAKAIAENLRRAGLSGGRLVPREVLAVLRDGPAAVDGTFGACFLDPPYADTVAATTALELLGDERVGWLTESAVVVAKHFWRAQPPAAGGLVLERTRRFGETALSYYRAVWSPAEPVAIAQPTAIAEASP